MTVVLLISETWSLIENLWIKYTETKDKEIKKQLIEHYVSLVKIVAGRMYNFYGSKIEYDDLLGYGILGLIDSIDKFDISKNIKFERYVPTAAIMDKTVLTIFHGGQDTMLTTLLYGVPSITIPGQHYERDYNSAKLESLGASVKLPVHASTFG